MALPRFIALCGHPKSGKSLVQAILKERYGVQPVDDGLALRDIAIRHYGATPADVETQEGKASLAYWPNDMPIIDHAAEQHMTWRLVLGRIGKQLEKLIGPYVMPMMATSRLPNDGTVYSFGSVRLEQGHYYLQNGGVIIGIRNPLAQPSGNDFDCFNESIVNYWIENDALARGLSHGAAYADLYDKVIMTVEAISLNNVVTLAA